MDQPSNEEREKFVKDCIKFHNLIVEFFDLNPTPINVGMHVFSNMLVLFIKEAEDPKVAMSNLQKYMRKLLDEK